MMGRPRKTPDDGTDSGGGGDGIHNVKTHCDGSDSGDGGSDSGDDGGGDGIFIL